MRQWLFTAIQSFRYKPPLFDDSAKPSIVPDTGGSRAHRIEAIEHEFIVATVRSKKNPPLAIEA
jgi:hypothetical protein